jgi:hypothetical protein
MVLNDGGGVRAGTILDFRFWILDYSREEESRPRYARRFLPLFLAVIQNPKSKIQNGTGTRTPIKRRHS